jgi:hypothetical protein
VVLSANVRNVDGIASKLLLDLERPSDSP